MTGYTYYVLHLTLPAQERLSLPEEISVFNFEYDEGVSKLDGRLWYKARLDDEKNLFLHIRHDEIKTSEEIAYTSEPSYKSSSNSCFIATACAANLDELSSLYNFRDKYLVNFSLGRKFIDFY